MLEEEIIPRLLELHAVSEEQQRKMDENPDFPIFTLVFDREAYSPAFLKKIWDEHRIAVLTYRKNVKDKWDPGTDLTIKFKNATMNFAPSQEV